MPLPVIVKASEAIVPTALSEACRRAAGAAAADAAVLIPKDRVAAGDGRVLQVEPVAAAGGQGRRRCDTNQINVIAVLVGGDEFVGQVGAAGGARGKRVPPFS